MAEVVRYRRRPVAVDTIQWTGDNEAEVQAFTGRANFYALDPADRENSDDPAATATVFDNLHSTWVLVYTGQHIVRGVKREYYPIAEDVLAETYEPADTEARPTRERWHLEYLPADRWVQLTRSMNDRQAAVEARARRRERHPDLGIRIVRASTSYVVEAEAADADA
ncbi:hypothetical protein PV413_03405 [Streptomyces scabiei]|uniref:hypothetical protein n=1 Tax=Streptomyces scabiei TaxID=1930 RepID=UPI0013C4B477|nr:MULTISPECIES: hypothetical protein [Streptomyces]MDX2749612.1 hypothetical protein [Streptomyces scabiei]MDX3026753.1 hypothetical protein [Streptomyces scabiei]MDX3146520.1 hypothetical protein [Streptomyces scabiei]MDX3196926.1 hypothetical protein [Streptomyces scabiei]MDX3210031.1 hypothetical protein [Streptomyces scabiei]